MRKLYLIFLLSLFLLPAKAESLPVNKIDTPAEDEYAGFASSWNYEYHYDGNFYGETVGAFTGLTTIDGQEYAVFNNKSVDETSDSGVVNYIRQSDGKVYVYIWNSHEQKEGEELLWDFNLEPGDILEGHTLYGNCPQTVVDKWTVDIDGPKRVLKLNVEKGEYSYTVVEGLGAMEYGTMASAGDILWKTGSAPAHRSAPALIGDVFVFLSSVSDAHGNVIYERNKTLVDYTPIISEDRVWEYGSGSGQSMCVERMAFRGTQTVNEVEYHCFGTLYRGPRVPIEGIESAVAFNPYLLREEFGKVYLLHTPGSYHVEENATEAPVESLLYDFTAGDGKRLSVFADGVMTEGTVSLAAPIRYHGNLECVNYTLWPDGPVFMECLGALSGGNLVEFGKECSPETFSLCYVYNAKGGLLYSAPGMPTFEPKRKYWRYRSYMPGKYVDFTMLVYWYPTEIDGKNYYSFYTSSNVVYDRNGNGPLEWTQNSDEGRFLIRYEGGRVLMRVPEQKVWPFLNVAEGVSEVCLYDFELNEGESYDMFTTSGPVKATLVATSTEKVFGKDALLQTFLLEGGKTIEVLEGIGNVTRGTYVTIDINDNWGNPEGVTPADMQNPVEGYATFLLSAHEYDGGDYSNEERLKSSVDSFTADDDPFIFPADRIFDLQGRELREPIPGQPYIKGGHIFLEK